MPVFIICRALFVRLCFAAHGLVTVFCLYVLTKDSQYWYLAGTLGFLLLESIVTIARNHGNEWKWFCPSVFFYLISTVPAIWFLELSLFDKRVLVLSGNKTLDELATGLSAKLPIAAGKLSIHVSEFTGHSLENTVRILEQLLLLLLIMGRWILPKGQLTRDQLSQLLLVYIGTAADIVEFFDAFKENAVKSSRMLSVLILAIWTWSLLQFTLVLTASKARKDHAGLFSQNGNGTNTVFQRCCNPDVFGILISIVLQDLPFLGLRMTLIFKYNVLSYTNYFFTAKNSIVITLLTYRLVVIQLDFMRKAKSLKNSLLQLDDQQKLVGSAYVNGHVNMACRCNISESINSNTPVSLGRPAAPRRHPRRNHYDPILHITPPYDVRHSDCMDRPYFGTIDRSLLLSDSSASPSPALLRRGATSWQPRSACTNSVLSEASLKEVESIMSTLDNYMTTYKPLPAIDRAAVADSTSPTLDEHYAAVQTRQSILAPTVSPNKMETPDTASGGEYSSVLVHL